METSEEEDRQLGELGYTQKLSRSVGGVSSFFLGFSVISATTAVFSGFGFGLSTAGPAFVWTFPLAVAVFFVWALIAADLVVKLPLAGYAYQWTSRLVSPHLGWFTGFAGAVGFISGFTGVAFVMSGYIGSLLGIEMSTPAQIFTSIAVVLLCVLINVYGVRLATMLNNIGVALELVVTIGATAFIAIVAFFISDEHQGIEFLFSGAAGDSTSPYVIVWLTASLGCIFGLLGVEAAADVAEETKNARRTIPRTMFLALGVASAIEFFMYIVFLLVIKDPATLSDSASPITDLFAQQVSPWFSKFVIALALTNILVCVLASMLVATRLVYALGRDNMLPGSRVLRQVSATHKVPTYAVWATGLVSLALLLSALANEQTFSYIIGMSALGFFGVYLLTTAGLVVANARKRIPQGAEGVFDLGRMRLPVYVLGLVVFGSVMSALLFLPDFRANAIVFVVTMGLAAVWWLVVLRGRIARAEAGPKYALATSERQDAAAVTS
ncbi:APC family permease [Mycolicibacterium iranicum]|uniref:Amino acid permease n=1 Tax=Mycolicibacterium iranicum TaxID=912594 RepID=A0A1X1WQ38_MYCIR|nr:amino acid permease [Mycolicibacterium iranicum]ORV88684.1 amino acid permease [Mycolicibacterium iranicum]